MNFRSPVLLAVILLSADCGRLIADEEKEPKPGKQDALAVLAGKLGLSDKQVEQLRTLQKEHFKKIDPVMFKFWSNYKEQQKLLLAQLTDAQNSKLLEALKMLRSKARETVSAKLSLTDEQKRRLSELADEYEPKFRALVGRVGEEVHQGIIDLRLHFRTAVHAELSEAQRARLPGVLRSVPGMPSIIRDDAGLSFVLLTAGPAHFAQPEFLDTLAEQLDLSAEQRTRFQKIASEFNPRILKLGAQVLELQRQERLAMEEMLTNEQRAKWRAMRKASGERE